MLANQGYLERGTRGAGTKVAAPCFRPEGYLAFLGKLNTYASEFLLGMQAECMQRSCFPIIFCPEVADIQFCLQTLNRKNVCGIISVGCGILQPPEGVEMFCMDYLVSAQVPLEHVHYINSDNYTGGKNIMEEILKRNHRDIVIYSLSQCFSGNKWQGSLRLQGMQEVMKNAEIPDFQRRTFYGKSLSLTDTKEALKHILKTFPETTLICTDSDITADMLHLAARELGIECPGDIALTGFGNITNLKIATVDQDSKRQGQLAARHLIDFAEGKIPVIPKDELVETFVRGAEYIPSLVHSGRKVKIKKS